MWKIVEVIGLSYSVFFLVALMVCLLTMVHLLCHSPAELRYVNHVCCCFFTVRLPEFSSNYLLFHNCHAKGR